MQTVEIYTSPLCGYCHAAKRLLAQKGVTFSEIDVLAHPDRKPEMIKRANGVARCPRSLLARPMSVVVMICTRLKVRASLTRSCRVEPE